MESHDLIDNIEQDFKEHDGLIVTLHYDPIVTDDPQVKNMRNWIAEQAREIDPRITVPRRALRARPHAHEHPLRLRAPDRPPALPR